MHRQSVFDVAIISFLGYLAGSNNATNAFVYSAKVFILIVAIRWIFDKLGPKIPPVQE